MFNQFKNLILKQASKLDYIVKANAPSDFGAVRNQGQLVIWDGASDRTIWGEPCVNYAFRALHDQLHIQTGLGFTIDQELELGRIQAAKYDGMLADLVYIEVAGQVEYFKKNGIFIADQISFTKSELSKRGYKVA